jgi:uncharacterized membrane protein
MRPPPHPSARAMTLVLRIGTAVSTTLLAIGVILALARPYTDVARLPLAAGLIILMATPVANLLVVLVDETAAREWSFVAIGVLVLALLGGSLFVAFC